MTKQELIDLYRAEATKAEAILVEYRNKHNILFNIKAPPVYVERLGRTGGQFRRYPMRIRLNEQLVNFPEEALNIIRHELAHWVTREVWQVNRCPKRVGIWSSHGLMWLTYARALGCTGDRCHSLPLKRVRKTRRWLYVLDSGYQLELSTAMHRKVQSGQAQRILRSTGERIRPCHYSGKVAK